MNLQQSVNLGVKNKKRFSLLFMVSIAMSHIVQKRNAMLHKVGYVDRDSYREHLRWVILFRMTSDFEMLIIMQYSNPTRLALTA